MWLLLVLAGSVVGHTAARVANTKDVGLRSPKISSLELAQWMDAKFAAEWRPAAWAHRKLRPVCQRHILVRNLSHDCRPIEPGLRAPRLRRKRIPHENLALAGNRCVAGVQFVSAVLWCVGQGHAKLFQAALNYTGFSPSECVHVGDHPEQDIFGAQQLGFYTVWININNQEWPGGVKASAEINRLSDLPRTISAIAKNADRSG